MCKSPDVIVIGAGIIGLSCAWRLTQRGARVLICERGKVGAEASAAALGVLAPPSPLKRSRYHALHRESLASFPAMIEELAHCSSTPISFKQCGSLEIIPTETQREMAQREVKATNADPSCSFPLEKLDKQKTLDREPNIHCRSYGSLFTRGAAFVSMEELLSRLRQVCLQQGVQIKEGARVDALQIEGSAVRGVRVKNEQLSGGAVLIAGGSWSSQVHTICEQYLAVEPVFGQALSVRTERPLLRHIVKWKRSYLVPQDANLIAVGSTTERNRNFNKQPRAAAIADLLSKAIEVLPELGKAELLHSWTGLRPAGPDRKPIIGPLPGFSGLYAATGHYKIGLGFAPLTARVISDLMLAGRSDTDITALYPRLTKVKKSAVNS